MSGPFRDKSNDPYRLLIVNLMLRSVECLAAPIMVVVDRSKREVLEARDSPDYAQVRDWMDSPDSTFEGFCEFAGIKPSKFRAKAQSAAIVRERAKHELLAGEHWPEIRHNHGSKAIKNDVMMAYLPMKSRMRKLLFGDFRARVGDAEVTL